MQAEAIADLAAAETEAQRRQALRQLDGELGGIYRDWSARLIRAARASRSGDRFSRRRPAARDRGARPAAEIRALAGEIAAHLADGRRGERLRDGIVVAIVGPPNAGKSSLFNRIARREAAITSPIAGTTRDIIEVAIDLAGYPVVLADTAGLRDSADPVEQEGLRRARRRAEDGRNPALRLRRPQPRRCCRRRGLARPRHNPRRQQDRPGRPQAAGCRRRRSRSRRLTGEGLDVLLAICSPPASPPHYRIAAPLLTRARHREALEEAAASLARALAAKLPELRAEDLRLALRSLGHITGAVDVEDVLDMIFRDFCLGK